jgi:hypothetical protein
MFIDFERHWQRMACIFIHGQISILIDWATPKHENNGRGTSTIATMRPAPAAEDICTAWHRVLIAIFIKQLKQTA